MKQSQNPVEIPKSIELSPVGVVLWKALQDGQRFSKWTLAEKTGCSVCRAAYLIGKLIDEKAVTICDWVRNGERGPHSPVIRKKTTRNKNRPKPLTNAECIKRYKLKNSAEVRKLKRLQAMNKSLTCTGVDFNALQKAFSKK